LKNKNHKTVAKAQEASKPPKNEFQVFSSDLEKPKIVSSSRSGLYIVFLNHKSNLKRAAKAQKTSTCKFRVDLMKLYTKFINKMKSWLKNLILV